ncbi:MAG: hypothetical protein CM1200mP40_20150 [Gammaproteobacteria bacterium]|nr:MAG: hypothetical protein CM1200mP40_20150 [Gammaproteobacteria bacterium]
MGNEIGKFSLEHVSNVYIQDANGQISNQTNWKGTSDVGGYSIRDAHIWAKRPYGNE